METARAVALGINSRRFAHIRQAAAQLAEHASQVAQDRAHTALRLFYIIGGGCSALALFLLFALNNVIAAPLALLTVAARRLAVGDTQLVLPEYEGTDEVGELTKSFSDMAESWRGSVRDSEEGCRRQSDGGFGAALRPG